MNEEVDTHCCFVCDKSFITNDDGTTNHLNDDAEVDHDEDANHVPYRIEDEA